MISALSSLLLRALLAKEEGKVLRDGGLPFPEDVSPSAFVSFSLDLQDHQYAILDSFSFGF